MNEKKLVGLVWLVCALLLVIAFTAWLQKYDWQLGSVTTNQLFPLLGLLAFNLMLSHYFAGVMRRLAGVPKSALRQYFRVTSYAVLVAILLHPGILAWNLWRANTGLPPTSFYNYVSEDGKIWILAGLLSLAAFLAYELKHLWRREKAVALASDCAMILILLHALFLGSHLQEGWYRGLWFLYGGLFVGSLIFNRWHDNKAKKSGN